MREQEETRQIPLLDVLQLVVDDAEADQVTPFTDLAFAGPLGRQAGIFFFRVDQYRRNVPFP